MFLNFNETQISTSTSGSNGSSETESVGAIGAITTSQCDATMAIDTIVHILSFTYLLLNNACNKDRYSSVEVSDYNCDYYYYYYY